MTSDTKRAEEVEIDEEGRQRKIPENTYHKDGPTKGNRAKGATRIDVILANPVAASSTSTLRYRWGLIEEAHAPLGITIDVEQMNADQVVQKTSGNVLSKLCPEDIAETAEAKFDEVYEKYGPDLERQIANKDFNGAHVTWNIMVEVFIEFARGKEWNKTVSDIEGRWKRGARPTFSKKQKTKPLTTGGNPVLHRQKELTNLRNRINDLRSKSKGIDFSVLPVPPL